MGDRVMAKRTKGKQQTEEGRQRYYKKKQLEPEKCEFSAKVHCQHSIC